MFFFMVYACSKVIFWSFFWVIFRVRSFWYTCLIKDLKLFRILVILRGLSPMFWGTICLRINHYFLFVRHKLINLLEKILELFFYTNFILRWHLFYLVNFCLLITCDKENLNFRTCNVFQFFCNNVILSGHILNFI